MPGRSLFSCYGVELEYMIVRRDDLNVVPWSDRILVDQQGKPVSDIECASIAWSNELTAHVIELKTNGPATTLDGLSDLFAHEVHELNRRFGAHAARLLPTGMHPWMKPEEAVLWAHEYNEVYEAFDRIFDCHGHGWSNLQSVHINLPFSGDEEFGRLHAAIRLVLPLLPALAASSPVVEGKLTDWPDNRLAFYRKNSASIPQLCGRVIPEPVFTEADYNSHIFQPILAALAPHDPAGVLEAEFSNSRGAIARFGRGSIEIRLLDIQECPAADLARVRLIVDLLREIVSEKHIHMAEQESIMVEPLARLFNQCVERGDDAMVDHPVVLKAFGCGDSTSLTAHALWRRVIDRLQPCAGASAAEKKAMGVFHKHGTLARRIRNALPDQLSHADLFGVYQRLADCLESNESFD